MPKNQAGKFLPGFSNLVVENDLYYLYNSGLRWYAAWGPNQALKY